MLIEALHSLVEEGRDLSSQVTRGCIAAMLDGKVDPAQSAAFLAALRTKGEVASEILGCAEALLDRAIPLPAQLASSAVDIGGTGGDRRGTFNISTVAALVVAAVGVPVAKHGNRAVTGQTGSADMMEALGIPVTRPVSADGVGQCLEKTGFTYLFTPLCFSVPQELSNLRRALSIRTVFNLAGPLANPAKVGAQLVGVFDANLVEPVAEVLRALGRSRALVVHGMDGLDEVSLGDETKVAELRDGEIHRYVITPEVFELPRASYEALSGANPQQNASICQDILNGVRGPRRNAVLACAGSVLKLVGYATTFAEGASLAAKTIDSGAASSLLKRVHEFHHDHTH